MLIDLGSTFGKLCRSDRLRMRHLARNPRYSSHSLAGIRGRSQFKHP